MAGVQIVISSSGGPQIQRALGRRSNSPLRAAVLKATREAANVVKPVIQAEAPYRTGATRRSVRVGNLRRSIGVSIGPRIWYRHFVIGGTKRGVEANPWVERGVRRAEPIARAALAAAMKASVR